MDYIPINMLTLSPPGVMTQREAERRGLQRDTERERRAFFFGSEKEATTVMLIHMKADQMFSSVLLKSNTKALIAVEHGVCSVNYLQIQHLTVPIKSTVSARIVDYKVRFYFWVMSHYARV